ncbi:hypothetical protein B0T13DRAFT_286349 [Neurospora crassa]|nr:hypothetical protein B0T13DRAFT_286349 [Neurospora crassa]
MWLLQPLFLCVCVKAPPGFPSPSIHLCPLAVQSAGLKHHDQNLIQGFHSKTMASVQREFLWLRAAPAVIHLQLYSKALIDNEMVQSPSILSAP